MTQNNDNTQLPPRPVQPPSMHHTQSEHNPSRQKKKTLLMSAGAAGAAVVLGVGSFVGVKMANSESEQLPNDPVATGEANPGEQGGESTETEPTAESNMMTPDMEYTVDNIKMETEADPTRMAEVYMNRHQVWNMAGADKSLYDAVLEIAGQGNLTEITEWEVGIERSYEHMDAFAEALAGEDWEDNPATAKWVEERRHQNSFNLGAYTITYDEAHTDWIYSQVDEINGKVTREDNEDGTYTLTIPIHSYNEYEERAGMGIDESIIPRYDFTNKTHATFKDLEDGTTVIVEETYSDSTR